MEQHFTVTTKHYVKTLERALKLYTPSLHEKSLADFLATVCEDLGFRDIHTDDVGNIIATKGSGCLLYTSPSPRDKRQSRMPSSA